MKTEEDGRRRSWSHGDLAGRGDQQASGMNMTHACSGWFGVDGGEQEAVSVVDSDPFFVLAVYLFAS